MRLLHGLKLLILKLRLLHGFRSQVQEMFMRLFHGLRFQVQDMLMRLLYGLKLFILKCL
jgi:hypothetical protein